MTNGAVMKLLSKCDDCGRLVPSEEARSELRTALEGSLEIDRLTAINTELVEALNWAMSRLDVDGGMTPKEQRTTVRRLRIALAKAKDDAA